MNADLTKLLSDLRRPGTLKALLGQAAIAIGTGVIADAADEAEKRLRAATDELDQVTAALMARGEELGNLVLSGKLDDAVILRAQDLGYVPAPPPPGPCGSPDCDDDPCTYPAWTGDGTAENPHRRTPADDAPDGQPPVPPRMGGYLTGLDIRADEGSPLAEALPKLKFEPADGRDDTD